MPFVKGQSGNPKGRPKQKPFLEWCSRWTTEKAEKFLAPIAEDPKHKQQMDAIKLIMAYGVGKPVETQDINAEVTTPDALGPSEAESVISALVARAAGAGDGSNKPPSVDAGK